MNPVKMLPKGENQKHFWGGNGCFHDEAIKIAEWLKLKTNQEPYYLFITCLESGARKSEVLVFNGKMWIFKLVYLHSRQKWQATFNPCS